MERDIEGLREYFSSGITKEASWRKTQLKALHKFATEREQDILKALSLDLGKHPVEGYRDEVGVLTKDINDAIDNLANWMAGGKIKLPIAGFPSTAKLVPEPLGLVLIISTWNFPIGLSLEPLIGAIAAGNTAVIKPSELAPASSALLAEVLPAYLDSKAVKVIQGGADVTDKLLQYKWDKIFFTGSCRVGRIVLTAAAKHLTPVTLELGGKCPAIIDQISSSFYKKIMAKRLIAAKFGACNAQACIAVDYILVEKEFSSTLIELLKDEIKTMFGDTPKGDGTRIINKHHVKRLKNLLDEPGVRSSVVYGGSIDEDKLYVEPTILVDPPLDATIMKEEIFGPLLPLITLENIEDSIGFINSKPKPLTIYCFSKNDKFRRRVESETSSGSLMFNDTIIHYAGETIPFGGVGASGYGRYHGKFSFDTFSHEKPIIKRPFFPDFFFRYPPWTSQKLELLRAAYVFNYFMAVLIILGLKRPRPFSNNA